MKAEGFVDLRLKSADLYPREWGARDERIGTLPLGAEGGLAEGPGAQNVGSYCNRLGNIIGREAIRIRQGGDTVGAMTRCSRVLTEMGCISWPLPRASRQAQCEPSDQYFR